MSDPEKTEPSKGLSGGDTVLVVMLCIGAFVVLLAGVTPEFDILPSSGSSTPDPQKERIDSQFSPWDGSHYAVVKKTKSAMHNPASFEHVGTKVVEKPTMISVYMTYRGTNGFGAVVTESVYADVDFSGNIKEFGKMPERVH